MISTEINQHRIFQLFRNDLTGISECELWDELSKYGNVTLYYMKAPWKKGNYTCYVNGRFNSGSDNMLKSMQNTLDTIKDVLCIEVNQFPLFPHI